MKCKWGGCRSEGTVTTRWPNGVTSWHCQEHHEAVVASLLAPSAEPGEAVGEWQRMDAEWKRLRWIEALARKREHAEEVYADAETAYNASHSPTLDRAVLQVDRLATERAEAILALRDALAIPPAALRQPSDTERQP